VQLKIRKIPTSCRGCKQSANRDFFLLFFSTTPSHACKNSPDFDFPCHASGLAGDRDWLFVTEGTCFQSLNCYQGKKKPIRDKHEVPRHQSSGYTIVVPQVTIDPSANVQRSFGKHGRRQEEELGGYPGKNEFH
jgi:hypothetical protein